ncbi:MAG TPA: hypothetical protein VER03_02155, partial [Bryobacteraceae bacterium]|nr:hypothetical protein [Bryobacteraceae bacterium]
RGAQIERLPTLPDDNAASNRFFVKLAPGRELETSTIGQPVSVVFDTFSGSSIAAAANRFQAAMSWAGNRIASVFGGNSDVANAPKKAREPESANGRRLAGVSSQ